MKVSLLGFCLLLVSCTSVPVLNIVDKPIVVSPSLSLEQTHQAIDLAASKLGWELEEIEPGLALATLHSSNRMAQVQIAYTPQKYSITYEKSNRLKYDAGNIHKNFNRWIKNLDKHIRRNLGIVRKIANNKESRVAVAYNIVFDFDTLESDDVMDKHYSQVIPFICDGKVSKIIVIDTIIMAVCITSGIAHAGAWSVDKILYAGDTKKWQSCLKRLAASLHDLDALAVLKSPVHTFLDTHKLIPAIELHSGLENLPRVAVTKHVLPPKFGLEFSLKGLEIKNIGGDGLVTFRAEGLVRKMHYHDRFLRMQAEFRYQFSDDRILRTWKKESHQSLTSLCEGKTDDLIKQQINGLIESLLKQMSMNLLRMNLWEKAAVHERALQSNSNPIAP